MSGVRAAEIKRIAMEFAASKPSFAMAGGGALKHVNGTSNKRSILLLNAMVGNLDNREGTAFLTVIPSIPLTQSHPNRMRRIRNLKTSSRGFNGERSVSAF